MASLTDERSLSSLIAHNSGAKALQDEKDGRLSQHANSNNLQLPDDLNPIEHRNLPCQLLLWVPER